MNAFAGMWPLLLFSVLLAAGMGLSVYLFVTLKFDIRGLEKRHLADQEQLRTLEAALGETRAAAQALETDLREVERQTGMLVAPAPTRSGLNLSRRTQVLRMHRAGQDNTGIATALGVPRAEVDLLLKVHRIVVEQI